MIRVDNQLDAHMPERPVLSFGQVRGLAVALSAIMAVGFVLSAFLCSTWYVPLFFFAVGLAPLLALGKTDTDSRNQSLDQPV